MASAVGVPVAAAPRAGMRTSPSAARPRLLAYPQLLIGGVALALLLAGALIGPLIVRYGPIETDFTAALTGPSASHVLGTDQLGRDSLSRALSGARLSLVVAAGTVILTLAAGVPLGLLSGLRRGWTESLIMRTMAGLLPFPGRILAMATPSVLAPAFP